MGKPGTEIVLVSPVGQISNPESADFFQGCRLVIRRRLCAHCHLVSRHKLQLDGFCCRYQLCCDDVKRVLGTYHIFYHAFPNKFMNLLWFLVLVIFKYFKNISFFYNQIYDIQFSTPHIMSKLMSRFTFMRFYKNLIFYKN